MPSPVQVMGVNGVSHHIVEDDLAGCMAALHWLAYVPAVLGSLPPVLPTTDPVSRPIGYCPGPSESPDPGLHTNGWLTALKPSSVWCPGFQARNDAQIPQLGMRPNLGCLRVTLLGAMSPFAGTH